ncbi:hypothetical protein [Dermatobacter hominis]|uniref:hypothetical protein n=1 Tax=Dermatobacter hominis TaxID=2884263 RepID=UPI001D103EEA|nr:hypothetical protein [Dermatobacter hominis]UDY34240.1 hypothetical protein LH044_12920 [Dermatobacter hominis]
MPQHDIVDQTDAPTRRVTNRWARLALWLVVLAVLAVGVSLALDTPLLPTLAAVLLGVVILRAGWFFLQSFATPPPEPPEPGTIRKVKLVYRCSICGAEVRMTAAPTEDPEPPRHCMEDMELVAPIE